MVAGGGEGGDGFKEARGDERRHGLGQGRVGRNLFEVGWLYLGI